MARKFDSVKIDGIKDVNKIFAELIPKHARNLSRAYVHGLASDMAKEAKKRVPIKTGTLKKAIKAKRRRGKPDKPVSDVIVTQGKEEKNDGFYWFFVENGVGGPVPQPERPFLRPAKDLVVAEMPKRSKEQFNKKLAALIKREQKKAAKK
jgi:HK97 gp10 family phage protein